MSKSKKVLEQELKEMTVKYNELHSQIENIVDVTINATLEQINLKSIATNVLEREITKNKELQQKGE